MVTCAVPKCKSGYRSQKEKFSIFRVPANIEMRKKWEAAIPGVVALRQTQAICEKHFEARYIIRKYIQYDANGKVIVDVPYQRPRLYGSAVPTIFDDNIVGTSSIYNKVHVPELVHITEDHQSVIKTSDEVRTKRLCIDFEDEVVEVPNSCDQQKSLEITKVGVSVNDKSFLTLGIDQRVIMCKNQPNYSAEVPKSWGVAKISKESGHSLLFTYGKTITKNDNEDYLIVQKCITFQPDKTLCYYVFGRLVNAEEANLVRSLDEIKILPEILQKYQTMNVCSGIGPIDIHYLQVDDVFQDPIEQWHHKKCSLISNEKRCNNCRKQRKLLLQKKTRLKKRKTLLRIHSISNPVEKYKLMAMRTKYNKERCKKNRAKARVTLLTRLLKDKKEELARMSIEDLQEKCSELKRIKELLSLKIALKENCSQNLL